MTKADMIETLITDAVERSETLNRYKKTFGDDDKLTSQALTEWAVSYETIKKLGLTKRYIKTAVEARRNA